MLAAPATLHASLFGNPCDQVACNPCDGLDRCSPKAGQWFLNGHIEAGFFANAHGQKSTYDGWSLIGKHRVGRGAEYYSGNTDLLQNTRLTGGQVNQVYLSMGKSVDGRRGLDIGGTIDFTWGSDAYLVQARGMEFGAGHGGSFSPPDDWGTEGRWGTGDYFAAFPQAYAEIAYGRLNVIAGKFYLPFGIDSYKSTENFFYSWSPTQMLAPTMGGGALAFYKASDQLTLLGGWIMLDEIGESSKNNSVAGGFIWTPGKRLNVRYVFATGENKSERGRFVPYDMYVHSLTATAPINKKLKYVFDWTYYQLKSDAEYSPGDPVGNFYSHSLMNELTYQYNKQWAFGTRFGVLSDEAIGTGWWAIDLYTVSLGANWTPNKWLTVKPELRYDWTGKDVDAFDPADPRVSVGTKSHQFSGGLSAVVKF